jgi:hypothetical protein
VLLNSKTNHNWQRTFNNHKSQNTPLKLVNKYSLKRYLKDLQLSFLFPSQIRYIKHPKPTSICYCSKLLHGRKNSCRMETTRRREKDSCLTCTPCWVAVAGEGRGRQHGGKSRGGAGKRRIGKAGSRWLFYRENLNIRRSKINYSYVIHPTSESSMWIVKWSRFDEIFTSAVSDRPSEQRFKKSNFQSTPEPLSNIFFSVTACVP